MLKRGLRAAYTGGQPVFVFAAAAPGFQVLCQGLSVRGLRKRGLGKAPSCGRV